MERLVVLNEGDTITSDDLSSEMREPTSQAPRPLVTHRLPLGERVREFKREALLDALRSTDGNQSRAAELLGLKQSNLSRMLKTLGLRRGQGRHGAARS
ncbi:MAG: hypothetical protein JRI68_25105 [Deltaproteobacteria bacterium]|nr:hypothetical protein [Deltaproteobacteria bacterium]